jgi:mycobactin lysine-N-oxygenase
MTILCLEGMNIDSNPLVVLGAGPKALAIHIKARVLSDLGMTVPRIVAIEMNEVGAHWSGKCGYTDGKRVLCTTPEKDLGFPYKSDFDPRVNRAMADYSWHQYLLETGRLIHWIDQGRKHPSHASWADYLMWAGKRSGFEPVYGEVVKIEKSEMLWTISYKPRSQKERKQIQAIGLVITGPGEPFSLDVQDDDPKICDGKSFWLPENIASFAHLREKSKIAIVGTGETAATIVLYLLQILHERVSIDLINQWGMVYTREQGFHANRYFSDPTDWATKPHPFRSEFIKRADRGVFSLSAKETTERASNVFLRAAKVRSAIDAGDNVVLGMADGAFEPYDRVVVAIGFNPLTCIRLLPKGLVRANGNWKTKFNRISQMILSDLSLAGTKPKLHLPMMAGLQQGPGFPNLTCLGLLSDRILTSYMTVPV